MKITRMKIGIIGAGKMATAMALGLMNKNTIKPGELIVSARSAESRDKFLSHFPAEFARATADNSEIMRESDVIIIAVEPEGVIEALKPLRELSAGKLVISVASRITLDKIEAALHPNARVFRAMPNTPMQIGMGASVYAAGKNCSEKDEGRVKKILESGGSAWKVDESLVNAAGALSGSGPAYVFHFIAALAEGGVELGLPPDLALALAIQTVEGSARMVKATSKEPLALADQVKTPGGSTLAAWAVFEKEDWHGSVKRAMRAALKRTAELSG